VEDVQVSILDLSRGLDAGVLFRPPDDRLRIDAFIPTIGRQGHAANLVELDNGDLLCAWFAGSREGTSDINIALSRLPHGAARWTEPVWVSEDATRSEQNPVLFSANLSVPLFIMRQSFFSMPREIEDAARIDGAGRWRLFLEIAVPFAASGMLVVAILTFVSVWGEYLTTITMIDDQNLYTLGVGLAMFDTGGAEMMQAEATVSQQGIKSAGYLLASIPAMLLYVAMQEYFVKGLTEGALNL
jgi:hypothetical protein